MGQCPTEGAATMAMAERGGEGFLWEPERHRQLIRRIDDGTAL